jgi:hypothetical protein
MPRQIASGVLNRQGSKAGRAAEHRRKKHIA